MIDDIFMEFQVLSFWINNLYAYNQYGFTIFNFDVGIELLKKQGDE